MSVAARAMVKIIVKNKVYYFYSAGLQPVVEFLNILKRNVTQIGG